MGDTDALRDKIAAALLAMQTNGLCQLGRVCEECDCFSDGDGGKLRDESLRREADAVLPVVTQEAAQALSLLRSRVEALADELDKEATLTIHLETARSFPTSYVAHLGRRGGLRDAAQRLRRSLLDNKEQQ